MNSINLYENYIKRISPKSQELSEASWMDQIPALHDHITNLKNMFDALGVTHPDIHSTLKTSLDIAHRIKEGAAHLQDDPALSDRYNLSKSIFDTKIKRNGKP